MESRFLEPTREHWFRLVEKSIVQKVMVNFPCLIEGEETAFGSIKLSEVSETEIHSVWDDNARGRKIVREINNSPRSETLKETVKP